MRSSDARHRRSMVESRTAGGETDAHAHEDAPQAFTRYAHPYDLGAAGPEDAPGGVMYVPLVTHASYARNQPFTRKQKREALIKQSALRIVAGLETRSLRELGREIGCSKDAIHKSVMRFCERLGLRPMGAGHLRRMREDRDRRRSLALQKV